MYQCNFNSATKPPQTSPGFMLTQLTQFHFLQRGVGIISGPFAGVLAAGHIAGDLCLWGAQVHQQGGDLGLELQGGRVLEHTQQVQLEVFTHTAHLGLGQCWGQVGCKDRGGSSMLGTDHCVVCQAQFSVPNLSGTLSAVPWKVPRLAQGLVASPFQAETESPRDLYNISPLR